MKNNNDKNAGWSEPVDASIAEPQNEASCKDRTGRFVRVTEEMRHNYLERMAELAAFRKQHGPQPVARFISAEKKSKSGIVVTPDVAMEYLRSVRYNRLFIKKNLQDYSMIILNGQWIPNHTDSTKFDTEGYLGDANHRMHCVILTGVPIIVRVDLGLSHAEIETLNSRKAARSAQALSGYQFEAPLANETIHGVKTLLATLGQPLDIEGVDTPYKRIINTYKELIDLIVPALPKKSNEMPNYSKGEVIAVLLMIGIVNRKTLVEWLPKFNLHLRYKTCELSESLSRMLGWLDKYVEGRAVEMDRSPTDYVIRCKAFLKAILSGVKPKNGANGLDDQNFMDTLVYKLLHEAQIDVQLSDVDRAPTTWRNDPNYVRERKK